MLSYFFLSEKRHTSGMSTECMKCYREAHGQRSLALALSRERVPMGFDRLFLDTENHVVLASVR